MTLLDLEHQQDHYERQIVPQLVETFRTATNSYKFLFFKAILDALGITGRKGDLTIRREIPLTELYFLMFENAYYPITVYRLSLGKQDMIASHIDKISKGFEREQRISEIFPKLRHDFAVAKGGGDIKAFTDNIDKYVRFRFLRPWMPEDFNEEVKGKDSIVNGSIRNRLNRREERQNYPYFFDEDESHLIINDHFYHYLLDNAPIVYDFWRWKFASYLSARNPFTHNIIDKIEPPLQRDLNFARLFWRKALGTLDFHCIYTNEKITATEFSLDHFIPWSFVLHDRLWNLIPTSRSANSSKSDSLPDLNLYLNPMIESQFRLLSAKDSFLTQREVGQLEKEYLVSDSRPSLVSFVQSNDLNGFSNEYRNVIETYTMNARNQGFPANWSWRESG